MLSHVTDANDIEDAASSTRGGQCVVMCLEGGSVGIIQFDSCKIYLTLVASSEVTNPSFKKR